ncbi:hypothetical protein SAMN02745118_02455, partial [Selenihalanaerobacter shriftii]
AELKNLSRQYEKITQLYRETQLKFRSIVDLIFPQFDTTFTNLCCKTSLKVISAFPTPEAMLNADQDKLKSILKVSTHSEA